MIPLVAAGIAWKWAYSPTGVVNQLLSAVGLGGLTRPWLADFGTALPAVGFVGAWVIHGFCTVLLLTGMGKIDPSLYVVRHANSEEDGMEYLVSWLRRHVPDHHIRHVPAGDPLRVT